MDLKAIQELVHYSRGKHPVISLYLNVSTPKQFQSEFNSLIRRTWQQLQQDNEYSKEQLQRLEDTFSRLQNYVQYELKRKKGSRLVAIFASPEGLWQEFQLPVALPSRMAVEMDPYVRPLTAVLDEFQRYCVLVLDARKARIFSLYLGDFDEHPEIFMEQELPPRTGVNISLTTRPGGVKAGIGDEHLKDHIDDKVHRHLKRVAEKTFNFFKENDFTLLILGGPKDKTLPQVQDHLHTYLYHRLAGEFHARPDDDREFLKQKALETAQEWERANETRLLDDLIETNNSGGKAVLGLEPTLEALMFGQIHTLVVDESYRVEGFVCPQDHQLSSYLKTCPVCGTEMQAVQDLADEIVEEAILQRSEVKHIFTEHEGFKPYSIGAYLRFKI